MRKIALIFFIVPLLLGGCASLNQGEIDAVERGEKAIILTRCTALTPPTGIIIKNYAPVDCEYSTWKAISGRKKGVIDRLEPKMFESIVIRVVEPGQYDLWSFSALKHPIVYDAYNLSNIATFDVQGGEIIYIGDMEFNLRDSAIIAKAISIRNNQAAAQEALLKRYPRFFDKLRTRLIQLSPYTLKLKQATDSIDTNFVNY